MAIKNGLSVDVEDYFHAEAIAAHFGRTDWETMESRVVENTDRVLDLLGGHNARATFFVLGWVAERFPKLVREIHARGHEIGCHSYWHRLIYRLTPDEFREDTRRAKDAIEASTEVKVIGYRAPSFSVTKSSLWALEILSELGFEYDSSIFPIRHDLYGIPDHPRFPCRYEKEGRWEMMELPISTWRSGLTRPPHSLPQAPAGAAPPPSMEMARIPTPTGARPMRPRATSIAPLPTSTTLFGSILVLALFQYLIAALLRSEDRAEQLDVRSRQLATLQLGVLSTLIETLALRDPTTARHAAAVAHLFLNKHTPITASGKYRNLDDSPSANVSPCAAPSQIVGGLWSTAVLIASAIAKMAQETIRLSGISMTSKCTVSKLTNGATSNRYRVRDTKSGVRVCAGVSYFDRASYSMMWRSCTSSLAVKLDVSSPLP